MIHKFGAVKTVMLPNGRQHLGRGFQRDLAAVGAIHLIAVVLGRVVAGRDADARAAAQIPHGPGQRRGGFQPGVKIRGDAVGGQHAGGLAAEQFALDAAVVGDGDLFGQALGVDVVGQPLRGAAHSI